MRRQIFLGQHPQASRLPFAMREDAVDDIRLLPVVEIGERAVDDQQIRLFDQCAGEAEFLALCRASGVYRPSRR